MLLHQRGYLVLHACTVALGDRAVAILGTSGQGKSTMAAALVARDHHLLNDDVTPARTDDGALTVLPGHPLLNLMPESAAAIGPSLGPPRRLHHLTEKRSHDLRHNSATCAMSLTRIYVLVDGDQEAIEALEGQAAAMALVQHSYAVRLLAPTGTAPAHLRQCAQVVSQIPVARLVRRRSFDALPTAARLIEADVLCGVP